jgi:Skp family chaperone for outer membrane proteins
MSYPRTYIYTEHFSEGFVKSIDKLGWIVAAGLGGVMIGGGFQGGQTKIGVVDYRKILQANDHWKNSKAAFAGVEKSREDLVQFLANHRTATPEQMLRYKALSTKSPLTDPEKAELTKLKEDIIKGQQKYETLVQKTPLTSDEQIILNDMGGRIRNNEATIQKIVGELRQELDGQSTEQAQVVVEKLNKTLEEIGKAGGYTVIFDIQTAPYGATDVTEAALKSLNAKK